jgi:hypothetical protein
MFTVQSVFFYRFWWTVYFIWPCMRCAIKNLINEPNTSHNKTLNLFRQRFTTYQSIILYGAEFLRCYRRNSLAFAESRLHCANSISLRYCHVYEWLCTGFRFVIGFMDHLQIVTTSNYSAIANLHTQQFTTVHTMYVEGVGQKSGPCTATFNDLLCFPQHILSLLSLLCLHHSLPYNGFQRMGSQTTPMPPLPASNSNDSQGMNRNSPLTHSLTNHCFIALHCSAVTELGVTLRQAVYRQSVHLDAKPLEVHDQKFFCSFFLFYFLCNWTLVVIVFMQHLLWGEDGFVSYE